MMLPVQSTEQLRVLPGEIRSRHKGFLTNFFLDEAKHSLWIKKGALFHELLDDTLFIVKKSDSFWNVFYCSTSVEDLRRDLDFFLKKYSGTTMVIDVVGRDSQCQPIVEMFVAGGGIIATSLVRMTRLAEPLDYDPEPTVRKAVMAEVPVISQLLHDHFDEQTEQIPYDEELANLAGQGQILVCEEGGQMAGFLIYEKNPSTLYLRYWFTNPDFRDRKVGSRLLRRFFDEGKETRRQLLWVILSNENALVRYKHYGFAEENMHDYVIKFN